MKTSFSRFVGRCRSEGVRSTLVVTYRHVRQQLYEPVRRRIPRKIGVFNGVVVRDHPPATPTASALREHVEGLYGNVVRQRPFLMPTCEEALLNGLRRVVEPGDDVVVVGGGRGVSAVTAAREVGPEGTVEVYEASTEKADLTRETATLNRVDDRVTVHEAVVGESIRVWGGEAAGATVAPDRLPDCDVLEMDCEGAEAGILRDLAIEPRACIVETHGVSSPRDNDVVDLLSQRGYSVVDTGVESEEHGCYIVTAVRDTE